MDVVDVKSKLKTKKSIWFVVVLAAIVLALIVGGIIAWQTGLINFNKGVYIPRANVEELAAESAEYIEYDGRVYRQCYDGGPEGSECLGKVNDGISGITGNVKGEVYPVEGKDPEFMLCVEIDDERYNKVEGDVYPMECKDPEFMQCVKIDDERYNRNDVPGPFHYYINDNDITLRTGEDWFGDKYNLKENVSSGYYEYYHQSLSAIDCFPLYGTPLPSEQVDEIIDVVYDSSFVYLTEEIESSVKKSAMCEIDFCLNDRTEVHMMICRAGYVLLDNFSDVCIKLDRPVLEDFFNQKNGGVGLK